MKPEDFTDYSAQDFALHEGFQQWVRHPDPDNERFWQDWLRRHPDKRETLQEARQLIGLIQFREDRPLPGEQAEVWSRIAATRQQRSDRPATVRPLRAGRRWYAWAAVVAGIALLGGVLYFLNVRTTPRYVTEYGQKRTITLPDGSEVVLNAHSSLRLAEGWEAGAVREVWLQGEAFFRVVKKSRPTQFLVHTDDLTVEVLGTQFNVASRKGDTRVVLNSGKVKLNINRADRKSFVMAPGDLVEFSGRRRQLTRRKVKPEHYNDWTANRWVFQSTPLQEVIDRLEETFGLEVTVVDPDIARERMSGIVSTENLDELIDALATINGLRMTRQNNQLTISR